MASIFTYDSEPPRVSSPWVTPGGSPKPSTPVDSGTSAQTISPSLLADYGVTKLEAEPQEGPTEYKLHLLLRPRRTYSSNSTGSLISGSQQQKQPASQPSGNKPSPVLAASNQTKQRRLEQLTTQLLWRLQQSSPYHEFSTNELVLPKLPSDSESLDAPPKPAKLLPGLEESRGALYEIGVSDDGTFVGLTNDEMDESLRNLRVMAASLGCNVKVVKMVVVGECEWVEGPKPSPGTASLRKRKPWLQPDAVPLPQALQRQAQLFVAEALVVPDLSLKRTGLPRPVEKKVIPLAVPQLIHTSKVPEHVASKSQRVTDQLRITFTGPTTSGKSTLLGTLSTGTLDNGRGKSRLSLLKHRHEIASGVTSSITQELFGYKSSKVMNWASGNVTSWSDIHASTAGGRLVFVTDSAGHPRYRRTMIRGLVGWAPHWTVLCVAGDDSENAPSVLGGTSSAQEVLGSVGVGLDLAKAHLDLCLKLDMPLVIVITKLDLVSKNSINQTVLKMMNAVKAAGRTTRLLTPDLTKNILESDLASISEVDDQAIRKLVDLMKASDNLKYIVPIIFTSASRGSGIRQLHALLQQLPISDPPSCQGQFLNPEQPASLFHIEETYPGVQASYEPAVSGKSREPDAGNVLSGHLRFGSLSVGDSIVVGPFPADLEETDSPPNRSGSLGASLARSLSAEFLGSELRKLQAASTAKGEWHNAHVISIRNLRLPVHSLEAGQVGTIGLRFDLPEELSNGPFERPPPGAPRIRKGMVLAVPSYHMLQTNHTLQAASSFTASFEDGDINSVAKGSLVVVYIASIRASARVVRLKPNVPTTSPAMTTGTEDIDDVFSMLEKEDGETNGVGGEETLIFGSDGITNVTFELMTNREWIELGSNVLVMPGGGHGLYVGSERGEKGVAGLEGFVGRVEEVVD